jgi:hypothetical protein
MEVVDMEAVVVTPVPQELEEAPLEAEELRPLVERQVSTRMVAPQIPLVLSDWVVKVHILQTSHSAAAEVVDSTAAVVAVARRFRVAEVVEHRGPLHPLKMSPILLETILAMDRSSINPLVP